MKSFWSEITFLTPINIIYTIISLKKNFHTTATDWCRKLSLLGNSLLKHQLGQLNEHYYLSIPNSWSAILQPDLLVHHLHLWYAVIIKCYSFPSHFLQVLQYLKNHAFWISWIFIPLLFLLGETHWFRTIHPRCEFKRAIQRTSIPVALVWPSATVSVMVANSFAIIPPDGAEDRLFRNTGNPTHWLALGSFPVTTSALAVDLQNPWTIKFFQSSLLRFNFLAEIPRALLCCLVSTNLNGLLSFLQQRQLPFS